MEINGNLAKSCFGKVMVTSTRRLGGKKVKIGTIDDPFQNFALNEYKEMK